jgi:small subunit ribosomal protein S4
MAKQIGPKGKIARRLGIALVGFPKTQKTLARRPTKPGEHGAKRAGKVSEYGKLLMEKQKLLYGYAIMERQFHRTFEMARRMPGATGENLLKLLETRLDTTVFRLHLAPSILSARQLVLHGHIRVNGKKINVPSYQLNVGDGIGLRERSLKLTAIEESLDRRDIMRVGYVEFDRKSMVGHLLRMPERAEIPVDVNEQSVVEFYSR